MICRSFPLWVALLATCCTFVTVLPAAPPSTPSWSTRPPAFRAQTKPRMQVPAEERSQARRIVNQLLKEGKIIRSSDVKRGMRGIARSVFQGTKIEEFPIEVVGVLQRVQGGGDLVLIRVLGGTVIKRNSGIIAGMSGSPVYINGKMLGAIAIGWGFPKEPIGGVTPITEMIETSLPDPSRARRTPGSIPPSAKKKPAPNPALPGSPPRTPVKQGPVKRAPAKRVPVTQAKVYRPREPLRVAGRSIARVVVSRDHNRLALTGSPDAATMNMRPVNTLLQLSGFSRASLPRLRKAFEPYGMEQVIGPSSRKTGVTPPFKPGGAIGVQLVSGDMDMTAVGTITFRWGQRILAFGHPMFGQGATSLPMTSSYIHDIFPSYQRSFKLASPVKVVGALQQDTQFAVGGTVGMVADTIPMRIALRDSARQIARTYRVRVMKDPVLTPLLLGNVAAEAMETALGLESDKMVRIDMRMQVDGAAPIVRHNYLYARGAVTEAALADLSQTLVITQMNEFARGSIRSVDLNVAVEAGRQTARIKSLSANRNKVRAGESFRINVVLEPTTNPDKISTRTFTFDVPEDAKDGVVRIAAGPAASYWPLQVRVGAPPPEPTNLKELIAAWSKVGASNELLVQASTPLTFLMIDRKKVPDPAPSWSKLMRATPSTAIGAYNEVQTQKQTTQFSLTGVQVLSIAVESRNHRDRTAPESAAASSEEDSGTATKPAAASATTPEPDVVPAHPGEEDPGGGEDPGDDDSGHDNSNSGGMHNTARLFERSPFLDQLTAWRAARRTKAVDGEGNRRIPLQTVPERQPTDRPITPAVTSPTPMPTPSATPTPSPTPTVSPIEDDKSLARPAQRWVQSTAADFLRGDFDRAQVTSEGTIQLAPATRLLATIAESFAWSIAGDSRGNTYLGTGNNARIFRINTNGNVSTLYDGPEVAVSAMTMDAAGNLYAGVTPGGRVYRFSPDGVRTVIFDSGQTFIWALEWDDAERLLIATGGDGGNGGDGGALYRINDAATRTAVTAAGIGVTARATAPLARVPQKHIRAISVRGKEIFVGTGAEGVLYRIDGDSGAAKALFQAGESAAKTSADIEVLAVAAAPDGVYFGTSTSGTVYRWSEANGVTTIYPSPQQAVYALRRAADGTLYAATGNQGVIYQIRAGADTSDTRAARILEPKQLQSLALALSPTGDLLVGTGNNAAAYRVALGNGSGAPRSGTFTSNVFDAKNVVQWGTLRVVGRGASIETRSGNTMEPDPTWSAWQIVTPNDLGELRVAAPDARYLQYRIRLSMDDALPTGPALSRLEVVYRTKNQTPTITFSAPAGGEYWSGRKKLNWSGQDPDKDTLRYRLWLSADDGKTWKPVELKDVSSTSFEVDTTKWTDGVYRARIEASDAARNPDDPRRNEFVSLPFVIDNTAPLFSSDQLRRMAELANVADAGTAGATGADAGTSEAWRLRATVTDALSPIAGAEWRIVKGTDGKKADSKDVSQKSTSAAVSTTASTRETKKEGTTNVAASASAPARTANGSSKPAIVPASITAKSDKTKDGQTDSDKSETTKAEKKDESWQAAAAANGIFDSRREEIVATIEPSAEVSTVSASGTTAKATTGSAATLPATATATTPAAKVEIRARDAAGNSATMTLPLP